MNDRELLHLYAVGQRVFQDAKLRGIRLSGAQLAEIDVSGADLTGASLDASDLRFANLSGANLRSVDFRGADLSGANLTGALLRGSDLRHAKLSGANLSRADLTRARLEECDLGGVVLAETYLLEIDLGPLIDASPLVINQGPSRIDHLAMLMSVRHPKLKDFVMRAGIPGVFAEYMVDCARSIKSGDLISMLQSTFISFGGPDEPFARRLTEALARHGVPTFFFPEDAIPGEKIHRVMRVGVNAYDRILLICSQASLGRPGVLNEIEEALAREARSGGTPYLIPIRLDDYVLSQWAPTNPDIAQAIKDRVVADFSKTANDEHEFQAQVLRLLRALKKQPAPGGH